MLGLFFKRMRISKNPKIDNVDIKDGQFPKDPSYALFQCVEDMRRGAATLDDLHRIYLEGGRNLLEKTANIENITGPEVQWIGGSMSRTFKGENITPLYYALMTGSQDAFRLLLAEGGDINKEFSFQCTSIASGWYGSSKKTTTLMGYMMEKNLDFVSGCFRCPNVQHAFFISMIQRRQLSDVLRIMLKEVEHDHKARSEYLNRVDGRGWQKRKIPNCMITSAFWASYMFTHMPSIAMIKQSLGEMDASYKEMFDALVDVLQKTRVAAEHKKGPFITYDDEGVIAVLDPIDKLIACFSELRDTLNPIMSNSEYLEISLRALLASDGSYDRNKKIEDYTLSICEKVNYVLRCLDGLDILDNDPDKMLQTIISIASKIVNKNDSELYREALLDFVKVHVNDYRKQFDNAGLKALADHLAAITLPVSAYKLSRELNSAASFISSFSVEVPRSSLRM